MLCSKLLSSVLELILQKRGNVRQNSTRSNVGVVGTELYLLDQSMDACTSLFSQFRKQKLRVF